MPAGNLKVTIAQLNPTVGDLVGNVGKIREVYFEAENRRRDLVVTPGLSVTGCPLDDLADDPDLAIAAEAALAVLRRATRGGRTALAVGAPLRDADGVREAVFVFRDGEAIKVARGDFPLARGDSDGMRDSFPEEGEASPFELGGMKIGVLAGRGVRRSETPRKLRDNGAGFLVSVDARPFHPGALGERIREDAGNLVAETGLPLLCVNAVGGQGETVFDGGSFFLDREGARRLQLPQWEECVMDYDLGTGGEIPDDEFPDPLEGVWRAMMLGVGDYVRKSGFADVVLGLSGGMDSALVAAVAGDCLGAEHVHCVRLPSEHTTGLSNSAAEDMCRTWGFSLETFPIGDVVEAAASTLAPMFPGGLKKLTAENMQARARGYLLMTLSNDRGWLLLSTGNRSEIAVGYATLYGDMCGGYNPLKDVFKTTVYALAEWRNRNRPDGLRGPAGVAIPVEIIERPPSAELSPGQKDTDSLPPYPTLDAILEAMIEQRLPAEEIVARGFDRDVVAKVRRMFKGAEYKRRQGAPGPGIGRRASLRGRRMPLVNGFDVSAIDALRGMEQGKTP